MLYVGTTQYKLLLYNTTRFSRLHGLVANMNNAIQVTIRYNKIFKTTQLSCKYEKKDTIRDEMRKGTHDILTLDQNCTHTVGLAPIKLHTHDHISLQALTCMSGPPQGLVPV